MNQSGQRRIQQAQAPDGRQVQVVVPAGVAPGAVLTVAVPANAGGGGAPQQQENILRLVRRQQFGANRIAEFLTDQRAVVILGNYRFDGSPLNYCTIEFVKPQLIDDETLLIAELRKASAEVNGDSAALRLLEQLITEEEDTLKQLHEL